MITTSQQTLSLDAIANANNVTISAGFVVTDGPIAGSKYILQQGKSSLGRHPDNGIFFDDITVSTARRVTLSDGTARVSDVGSLNGTYLNRRQIDESEQMVTGDVLQISKFKLVYFQESN